MRLDKFVAGAAFMTRNEARATIRGGRVTVSGEVCRRPETDVKDSGISVVLDGRELRYEQFVYLMMNKPAGVLSATEDAREQTVLDLVSEKYRTRDLFPVGRLDRDTVGLLIITDDGALAHELLSPKKHVWKTYRVKLSRAVTPDDVSLIESGVDIGEGVVTLPARFEPDADLSGGLLSIREGKFHQIKRMFAAVGSEVEFLERVSFGGVELDPTLQRGESRELTEKEKETLKSR